jgi:hypothetical protein
MAKLNWSLTDEGPLGPWLPERSEKKKILPKQAEWILQNCNTHNRTIVNASVLTVETALKEDTWDEYNGETIIFAHDGTLLDGQNRLWACFNSGKPLCTWVVFGNPNRQSFMSIDRGRNRTAASDLSILGEKNHKELAAILYILTEYMNGTRSTKLVCSPKQSTPVLLRTLECHPHVRESVTWATNHRIKVKAPGRITGFVHYVAGMADNPKINKKRDDFFERLSDGVSLEEGNPILTLRNRWYSMANNPEARVKRGMGALSTYFYLYTLVRAWNAYMMGHSLNSLPVQFKDKDRKAPDDIPIIRTHTRMARDKDDQDATESRTART